MHGELMSICVNLLMEMLYAFVVYEYFKTFFERKAIKGIYLYIFIINVIAQFLENSIPNYPDYCRVISTIVLIMAISCFYKGKVGVKIVFALLYSALIVLCELLIACIYVACGFSDGVYYSMGYFVTYILIFLIVKLLQYFLSKYVLVIIDWKTNLKILILTLASMFLAYCIFYAQYEMGIQGFYWRTLISIVILLAINIIMFNIFRQLSENLELRRKASIYEKEFNLLEQHMHEREELMKEFRVKRHDLKHQMLNLLMLLHEKNYDTLEKDIEKLAELDSLNGLFLVNTENSIIDTFVNSKYVIACENGIRFETALEIPTKLPFAGEDISVVLGNALDNAMEACMRGEVNDPYIKLEMSYDQGNLVIIVENSFDGILKKERKGGRVTRKRDSQQHGIGIHSIRNVIRKYNGYYHVDVEGRVYRLEMILYPLEG